VAKENRTNLRPHLLVWIERLSQEHIVARMNHQLVLKVPNVLNWVTRSEVVVKS